MLFELTRKIFQMNKFCSNAVKILESICTCGGGFHCSPIETKAHFGLHKMLRRKIRKCYTSYDELLYIWHLMWKKTNDIIQVFFHSNYQLFNQWRKPNERREWMFWKQTLPFNVINGQLFSGLLIFSFIFLHSPKKSSNKSNRFCEYVVPKT